MNGNSGKYSSEIEHLTAEMKEAKEECDWIVSGERSARDEAEDARLRLDHILESISDGFIAVDDDWKITHVNQRAANILNQPKPILMDRPIWSVLQKNVAGLLHDPAHASMEAGAPDAFEAYNPVRGRWYEFRLFPTFDGLSIFFRDVTEKRQADDALRFAEKRYNLLFQELSEPMFFILLDGGILDANVAALRLTGYNRLEMRDLSTVDLYLRPEDRPAVLKLLKKKGSLQSHPLDLKKKNGEVIHALITMTPVRDEKGEVTAYKGMVRDITGLRQLEEELGELRKQLG